MANRESELRSALGTLLDFTERLLCAHEDTHRAGTEWTICDSCGKKWSDYEGGFHPFEVPIEVRVARKLHDEVKAEHEKQGREGITPGHTLLPDLLADTLLASAGPIPNNPVRALEWYRSLMRSAIQHSLRRL